MHDDIEVTWLPNEAELKALVDKMNREKRVCNILDMEFTPLDFMCCLSDCANNFHEDTCLCGLVAGEIQKPFFKSSIYNSFEQRCEFDGLFDEMCKQGLYCCRVAHSKNLRTAIYNAKECLENKHVRKENVTVDDNVQS